MQLSMFVEPNPIAEHHADCEDYMKTMPPNLSDLDAK